MSIISRSNPLNLKYRICIVTAASSALGIIICKTLLKANAFVLGIDTRPQDHSLNAGLGTHFQFLQCDVQEEGAAQKVVAAAREKFDGIERIDVLVTLADTGGEIDGLGRLSEVVGGVMAHEGRGSVIHILAGDEGSEKARSKLAEISRCMTRQYAVRGVRCNILDPQAASAETSFDVVPSYEVAKTHMTALIKSEKVAKDVHSANEGTKQAASQMYDVANLTLFLAGDMSEGFSSQTMHLDEACSAL
ncbi:hypothetical protein LTR97_007281 [Elasticomyces elasticus]|uniref:NAD(P)-binding protein n=1 Tax=Elasticomyces elasticus TaxID=574655 RepID=A0AAN7ZMR3_9PEZI|nr:hypothetical protein LTR97_007281 [Elasticomyces elasticus]